MEILASSVNSDDCCCECDHPGDKEGRGEYPSNGLCHWSPPDDADD